MKRTTDKTLDALDAAFKMMRPAEGRQPGEFTAEEYKETHKDPRTIRAVSMAIDTLVQRGLLVKRVGTGPNNRPKAFYSLPQ